ncbi:MAG: glucose-1-phosphate adenylyltransferase subunit GlgD [Bacilli bacterium]|jgi:glucose-1-phosphate adenylyltransferase|nr:glucose-1-phosphate adenylyltransferase subunit GlgD [Bacilli bacterium]NLN79970.1 glucose-1-phosphate adenylyltransferase subunit GlgD [Erysipelotrichia bacterium]
MAHKVFGILNLHSAPELGPLTKSRSIGAASFMGRYAFMDFPLSNFSNSGIDEVGILVKNHLRSVLKHLGSMQSFTLNTKIGRHTIMFNESAHNKEMKNTDLNNLLKNDWVFFESKADYIVIQPTHVVCKIDFVPLINEHVRRGEKVSLIYAKVNNATKTFLTHDLVFLKEDYVRTFKKNQKEQKEAFVSLETYIINRDLFFEILEEIQKVKTNATIEDAIKRFNGKLYKIHAIAHIGYVRSFASLEDYYNFSQEILDYRYAHQVFLKDWPLYTLTRDTTPALYSSKAHVRNSFIANGAYIEGRVENSVIARNVQVLKGAVVKNSIILSDTIVGENTSINYAVVDKYCRLFNSVKIEGEQKAPTYVEQGKKT